MVSMRFLREPCGGKKSGAVTFFSAGSKKLYMRTTTLVLDAASRLGSARLQGTVLACPICSQHYDVVRAGRGVDLDTIHLEPVPLLSENGRVRVALPFSNAQRSGM